MFESMNFSEVYENYSEAEKLQFQKAAQRLLSVTYINRNKGDITKWDEDYLFIQKNQNDFLNFFFYLGMEMNVHDSLQVISLESKFPAFKKKLDKVTTQYCLALRLVFDEKVKEFSGSDQVIIRSADFIDRLNDYGINEKKMNMQNYSKIMRFLSKRGIILRNKGSWEDIDTTFIIYPTITLLLPEDKMKDTIKILKSFQEVSNIDQTK